MKQYIAYYRVSTARQGVSGLGLEAQEAAVAAFVAGRGELVNFYREVESGKNNERVELAKAFEEAKRTGATLVIAKLDRLSRSASFIFKLRDAEVDFVCCDIPDMSTLTVGLFAVIAQHEREVISQRVKVALEAKRARGEALGNPANFTKEGRVKGALVRAENARNHESNIQAKQLIQLLLKQPKKPSLRDIASALNGTGYRTRRGYMFTATQVMRLAA
jgi:DNA invertase Pin-like site-specific DNA recombinase